MKLKLLTILIATFFTSCDGGSDDNNNSSGNIVTPPADPTNTSASDNNTSSPDSSGANNNNEATYNSEVHSLINGLRNTNGGLAALTRDADLDAIAAAHNVSLINNATLNANPIQINHDGFSNRATAVFALGYVGAGENVGGVRNYASTQVANAFATGWDNSPGHKANIVGDFTHTGVDVMVDMRDGTIYATQIFAKSR